AIDESADDLRAAQEEDSRHLVAVALDPADAVLEERSFEPACPDDGVHEVPEGVRPPERKQRMLVDRRLRIVYPVHFTESVVVEVDLGQVGRTEVDKNGADAAAGPFSA